MTWIWQVIFPLLHTLVFTLLWYGAVEKAGQWVSKDDVELKECFDKEYEEKKTTNLSRAVQ